MTLRIPEKTVYFPNDPAILAKIVGGNFQVAGRFLFWMCQE